MQEATALVARIEKEEQVTAGLKRAMASRSKTEIEALLQAAAEMNMETDEVRQAQALKVRLEEEEATVEALRVAIANKDFAQLTTILAKASEMGIRSPEVDQGKRLHTELQVTLQNLRSCPFMSLARHSPAPCLLEIRVLPAWSPEEKDVDEDEEHHREPQETRGRKNDADAEEEEEEGEGETRNGKMRLLFSDNTSSDNLSRLLPKAPLPSVAVVWCVAAPHASDCCSSRCH